MGDINLPLALEEAGEGGASAGALGAGAGQATATDGDAPEPDEAAGDDELSAGRGRPAGLVSRARARAPGAPPPPRHGARTHERVRPRRARCARCARASLTARARSGATRARESGYRKCSRRRAAPHAARWRRGFAPDDSPSMAAR